MGILLKTDQPQLWLALAWLATGMRLRWGLIPPTSPR
jgi:hypothetical protein